MNNASRNANLKSFAQRRSFWGRLNEPLGKPSFSMEKKIIETDDLIRQIALNHGSSGTSLSDDIKLAKKAFSEERLIDVRKHLADYNLGLFDIVKASEELLSFGFKFAKTEYNIKKYAGIFDFFKKKNKDQPFEKKHRVAISDKKEGIEKFLKDSIDSHNKIKNIFDKLDKSRVKRDVQEYIKDLMLLESEQKSYNDLFNTANKDFFNPLFGMRRDFEMALQEPSASEKINEELMTMKEELYSRKPYPSISHEPFKKVRIEDVKDPSSIWKGYQSDSDFTPFSGFSLSPMSPLSLSQLQELRLPKNFNDFAVQQLMTSVKVNRTDYCPCGSGDVWGRCHGKDEDKINEIANSKGISIEKAERVYFKNIADAVRRKLKKEQAGAERERRFKEHQYRSKYDPDYIPDSEMEEMEEMESPLASKTRKSILDAIMSKQKKDNRKLEEAEKAARMRAIEEAKKIKEEMLAKEKTAYYSKSYNRIKLAKYLAFKY